METSKQTSAEEVLIQLSDLLDAAENGETTIITRYGQPVAAIVPVVDQGIGMQQVSLLSVAGTGRGLWSDYDERLRDDWSR